MLSLILAKLETLDRFGTRMANGGNHFQLAV
jgi:hypothetical protein